MHYAIKKLIKALITSNIQGNTLVPSTAQFRLMDIDDFSAYVLAYSPNGYKIKLCLTGSGEIIRMPLPARNVIESIEKTPLYGLDELKALVQPVKAL